MVSEILEAMAAELALNSRVDLEMVFVLYCKGLDRVVREPMLRKCEQRKAKVRGKDIL